MGIYHQKQSVTSTLFFASNKSGIKLLDTSGYKTYVIKYLHIIGAGTDTTKHGIYTNGIVDIENVSVTYFPGEGVALEGCALVGSPIFGANDRSVLNNVAADYNGKDGFFINGCDANVISVINCSATSNYRWGFFDDGFLGNTYQNCHTNNNGLGNPNLVSYGGKRYYSILY